MRILRAEESRAEVSVIVPIYNVKDYLERCIDSIKEQTFSKFEVILIDDGSTDGSDIIVDRYSQLSNFIIKHIPNSGVSKARNLGLSLAKGKYIMFIDADDYIKKDYIECMYNVAENNADDIVISGYFTIDEKNSKTKKYAPKESVYVENERINLVQQIVGYSLQDMKKWLKYRNFSRGTTVWAKLYKTSILKEKKILFDEKVRVAEDVPFNMMAYLNANKIEAINYCGYYYLQRSGSAMHRYLNGEFENLLDNKCYLAYRREKIASEMMERYNYNIRSMYAGSLILSCGEIAVSLAQNPMYSLKNKVRLYRKYSTLETVKAARQTVTLSDLSFKYIVALLLIKYDLAHTLMLGLILLNKLNIKIGL